MQIIVEDLLQFANSSKLGGHLGCTRYHKSRARVASSMYLLSGNNAEQVLNDYLTIFSCRKMWTQVIAIRVMSTKSKGMLILVSGNAS
jgi:hypothetical protein